MYATYSILICRRTGTPFILKQPWRKFDLRIAIAASFFFGYKGTTSLARRGLELPFACSSNGRLK